MCPGLSAHLNWKGRGGSEAGWRLALGPGWQHWWPGLIGEEGRRGDPRDEAGGGAAGGAGSAFSLSFVGNTPFPGWAGRQPSTQCTLMELARASEGVPAWQWAVSSNLVHKSNAGDASSIPGPGRSYRLWNH